MNNKYMKINWYTKEHVIDVEQQCAGASAAALAAAVRVASAAAEEAVQGDVGQEGVTVFAFCPPLPSLCEYCSALSRSLSLYGVPLLLHFWQLVFVSSLFVCCMFDRSSLCSCPSQIHAQPYQDSSKK